MPGTLGLLGLSLDLIFIIASAYLGRCNFTGETTERWEE